MSRPAAFDCMFMPLGIAFSPGTVIAPLLTHPENRRRRVALDMM